MTSAARRRLHTAALALGIGLGASAAVEGLRYLGALRFAELHVYDRLVARRAHPPSATSPVVIVAVRDDDTDRLGYPVPDAPMAQALRQLIAASPRAVGLDLYRDRPEPRAAVPDPALTEVLRDNPEIVAIFRAGDDGTVETPPPAALSDRPSQVGFNKLLQDPDGLVRRCVWSQVRPDGTTDLSLAFRLAQRYLYADSLSPVPDPADPAVTTWGKARLASLPRNAGPYAAQPPRDAAGYQFMLDLRGPRTFTTVGFGDVLAGLVPPETFTDKVVLIGSMERWNNDQFNLPTGDRVYGVEAHAAIVDQFVRAAARGDRPLRFLPAWADAAVCLGWGLLGACIGLLCRRPITSVGGLLAAATALAALGLAAFGRDLWLPVVPGALACVAAGLVTAAHVSLRERRDREGLLRLFGGYVDPAVAAHIWDSRDAVWSDTGSLQGVDALRSRRLVATVLFTDLKGFSAMSEEADPEQLVPWLNTYLESMAATVRHNHGMVNKFIGDAVMAVFGVPVPREGEAGHRDDAINAVRTALAMRRELARLNRAWAAAGQPTGQMRIGIHTGPLVAGGVGSRDRFEYTVIGDTVNVAARLESHDKSFMPPDVAADGCRIIVGGETARLVAPHFDLRPVGTYEVHGRRAGVLMFGVAGESAVNPPPVTLPPLTANPSPTREVVSVPRNR